MYVPFNSNIKMSSVEVTVTVVNLLQFHAAFLLCRAIASIHIVRSAILSDRLKQPLLLWIIERHTESAVLEIDLYSKKIGFAFFSEQRVLRRCDSVSETCIYPSV